MDNNMENTLLSRRLVEARNYGLCKKAVDEKMLLLEEYIYKYNEIKPPKITPNYEVRYEMFTGNSSDKVGDYVARRVDLLNKVDKFYTELTTILKKMTKEELFYFSCTYFNKLPESVIADRLHISKNTLVTVKESCIVKVAMHFDVDVLIAE